MATRWSVAQVRGTMLHHSAPRSMPVPDFPANACAGRQCSPLRRCRNRLARGPGKLPCSEASAPCWQCLWFQGDSVVGLIEVFSPKHDAFRDRDEEVLTRMARVCTRDRGTSSRKENADSTTAYSVFAESLKPDVHRFHFQKAHAIILVVALALAAVVLGYLLAPRLQRLFSTPPKTVSNAALTTPATPQPVALKNAPAAEQSINDARPVACRRRTRRCFRSVWTWRPLRDRRRR